MPNLLPQRAAIAYFHIFAAFILMGYFLLLWHLLTIFGNFLGWPWAIQAFLCITSLVKFISCQICPTMAELAYYYHFGAYLKFLVVLGLFWPFLSNVGGWTGATLAFLFIYYLVTSFQVHTYPETADIANVGDFF